MEDLIFFPDVSPLSSYLLKYSIIVTMPWPHQHAPGYQAENDDVHHVRRSSRTGRPAGDCEFEKKIGKLTGRCFNAKNRGLRRNKEIE